MEERFDFGEAVSRMKRGARCARAGWNGKGMHVFWATVTWAINSSGLPFEPKDPYPCLVMLAADGRLVFGWLASQTDMLATDWTELPPP